VSNALKFSPTDTTIDLSVLANSEYITFAVKDEGPGLNEDDKAKLFQKYTRLSAKPTGGETSIGLGLSIVKRMVDTLHGNIWVESIEGDGAMFVVQLPRVWKDLHLN
jgi:two-component system, sensor histidine kinase and response regulator